MMRKSSLNSSENLHNTTQLQQLENQNKVLLSNDIPLQKLSIPACSRKTKKKLKETTIRE